MGGFGGDRGQMDFGVLRQPSQPMGGMGGQQPLLTGRNNAMPQGNFQDNTFNPQTGQFNLMDFDQFVSNEQRRRLPHEATRTFTPEEQKTSYQNYLDRTREYNQRLNEEAQANPIEAINQRNMLNARLGQMGGMGGIGGMGQRQQPFNPFQQQPQFNPFQQQPTPESLYAANMGMPPPQQFNQQRFNPFDQQFGGFPNPRQQPGRFQQQQQPQDMRGLAQLLSLLKGRG
jgi:hypothetical protein